MTQPTQGHSLTTDNERYIYALGGSPTPGTGSVKTVEKYDTQANTWTTLKTAGINGLNVAVDGEGLDVWLHQKTQDTIVLFNMNSETVTEKYSGKFPCTWGIYVYIFFQPIVVRLLTQLWEVYQHVQPSRATAVT